MGFVVLVLLVSAACGLLAGEKRASAAVVSREILSGKTSPVLTLAQQKEWSEDTLHGSVAPLFDAATRGIAQEVFVRVVLVGFAGDITPSLSVSDKEMLALLGEAAAMSQSPIYTLRGVRLPVNTSIHYSVSLAHPSLASRLHDDIARRIGETSVPQMLPAGAMNTALSQAYSDLHSATPAIFIVNAGRHRAGYSWSIPEQQCGTVHYASANQRFAWLDVNAGPLEWGPISSGDGGAMRHGLPFIFDSTMFPRHHKRFLDSISGYISRTTSTLLLPSVSRMPFVGAPREATSERGAVEIRFVFAHEYSPEDSGKRTEVLEQHRTQVCGAISSFAPPGVKVELQCIDARHIESSKDIYIAAALEHSRRFATSHLSATAHGYLDSQELHYWLRKLIPHIDYQILSYHSLPIVVLHTRDFILLDRTHQAVAFNDMIIAVVSSEHSGMMVSYDYFCNSHTTHRLRIDSANATRAIISAALDSLWGVAPLHHHYEPEHDRVVSDYVWSVAGTPASLFSSALNSTSFFIPDAAGRNAVLQAVWSHYNSLRLLVLDRVERSLAILKIIPAADYVQLVRRWNLWLFKRGEMESELSLQAYGHALLYLESMQSDLAFIAEQLEKGLERTTVERDCDVGTGSAWGFRDVGAVVSLMVSIGLSTVVFGKVLSYSLKTGKKKHRSFTDKLPTSAAKDFLQ